MLLCEEKILTLNDIQVTGEYESVDQEQNERNENILVVRKVSRAIIEIKG